MAIAVCLLTALACSVSPAVPKTTGKMEFVAEKTTIEQGDCVNIFWDVEGGANVKLNNEVVQLTATRYVCPDAATTYVLSADFANNTELRKITIQVNKKAAAPTVQSQVKPSLDFWADKTTISKGECTMLHWRATGGGVWIGEKGYPPESEMEVCPAETQKYTAEVGDQFAVKSLVITVQAGGEPAPAAQPQAQPQQAAAQQPPNPVVPKQEPPLSFTFSPKSGYVGDYITFSMNQVLKDFFVYYEGKDVSVFGGSTKEFSVHVPFICKDGYFRIHDRKTGKDTYSKELFHVIPRPHLTYDLAVTDIFPDNQPRGNVFVRITNRGPDTGQGEQMDINCNALITPLTGVIAAADPISVNLGFASGQTKGQTKEYDTTIDVDSDSFSYMITCSVKYEIYELRNCREPGSGDPNPSNNQYSEAIP